jgi:hypothetical protein
VRPYSSLRDSSEEVVWLCRVGDFESLAEMQKSLNVSSKQKKGWGIRKGEKRVKRAAFKPARAPVPRPSPAPKRFIHLKEKQTINLNKLPREKTCLNHLPIEPCVNTIEPIKEIINVFKENELAIKKIESMADELKKDVKREVEL